MYKESLKKVPITKFPPDLCKKLQYEWFMNRDNQGNSTDFNYFDLLKAFDIIFSIFWSESKIRVKKRLREFTESMP